MTPEHNTGDDLIDVPGESLDEAANSTRSSSASTVPLGPPGPTPGSLRWLTKHMSVVTAIIVVVPILMVLAAAAILFATHLTTKNDPPATQKAIYGTDTLSLAKVKPGQALKVGLAERLEINGELQVNGSFVLSPTTTPDKPVTGQVYYDKLTNAPYYYDGTKFVNLGADTIIQGNNGPAGGDLTGTYPNPTIASGAVTGFKIAANTLTNANLAAGNFGNIGGVGALTSGTIGLGFGAISTNTDIRTSGQVQGGTVNAVGTDAAIQLNGADINTAGILSNVAYLNQANVFTQTNTFNGLVVNGDLNLANSSTNQLLTVRALSPSGTGNATLQIPAIAGGSTDTVCLATLNNCSAIVGGGPAGGDLTGTYPNPTIAKLQGKTLDLSSPLTTGSVLKYNGSSFVGGLISNANLQTGAFGNIIGTGALTSGSIGSGFGAIATDSPISTTGGVQAGTLSVAGGGTIGGSLSVLGSTISVGSSIQQGTVAISAGNARMAFLQTSTSLGQDTVYTLPNPGSASDTICLVTLNNCAGAGGVASLDGQTGLLTLANSSGSAGVITINDASTAQKGIAKFSSTNFTASGGLINTIQDITTTASPTFNALTLSSALTVGNGGTGNRALTLNGVLYGNGTSALQATDAAANSILATNGSNVPGLTQFLPTAVQGNITGTGGLVSGSIGLGFGAISTGNSIATTAAVQGGTLLATSSITAGNGSQMGSFVLNAGNTRAATIQSIATLGQNTLYTLPDPGTPTATICLSTGNCAGSGIGITGTGTAGRIAKFSSSGNILDSTLSETGSTVTATGNVVIQGANSLSLGTASSNTGSITFNNGTNGNTISLQSGVSGSSFALILPTTRGNNGDCLQTDGLGALIFTSCTGGAGGGVTSLDSQTGLLTLANSSGSAGVITLNDASTAQKGIAQFNSTNFTTSGGIVNTVQDIAATATPAFNGLTLANALNVASGGTGANTFALNGVLYGNGTGALQATGAAANAILATSSSNVPGLTQFLPTAVQGNIIGTGALASGSIGNGFGAISTGNNIATTATVQGGTLNGTSAIQLNGVNINTAGTLNDVAYLDQANNFSARNTFNATGTALIVNDTASIGTLNVSLGGIANTGNYNGNTFTSSTLSFSATSASSVRGANNQNLTVQSQGTGILNLIGSTGGIVGTSSGNISLTASGTGTLTLDTATGAINVGTSAATKAISIGNTSGATAVNIRSGTGGILLGPSGTANTGVVVKPGADSTAAFRIQSASGVTFLNADSTTLGITVGNGAAPATFLAKADSTTDTLPYAVATGDFNGDGKMDAIAGSNRSFGGISVFINTGTGLPTTATSTLASDMSPAVVATGDFNGDGKMDAIAVGSSNPSRADVFINTGTGLPTTATSTLTASSGSSAVATGDFNGDGITDAIITGFNSNDADVYISTGTALPTTATSTLTGLSGPRGVATGDFNGDGKTDIIVANSSTNSASIFINTGTALPATATSTLTAGNSPYVVATGDFNGDGITDAIVGNYGNFGSGTNASIFINTGTDLPTTATSTLTGLSGPRGVATGDFNGDGRMDAIITNNGNSNGTTASVFINTGTGLPTTATSTLTTGTGPFGIATGDFNSDGRLDTIVANTSSNTVSTFINTTVTPSFKVLGTSSLQSYATNAFQIQNSASGSTLFGADTINNRIGIGAVPANGLLTVGTDTTTAAGGIYFGDDTNLYRSAANMLSTGSLTVNNDLTVTGAATISGTLTVVMLDVGTIKVSGHIVTQGTAPVGEALPALGSGATVVVTGTDTAGTITITSGLTGLSAGSLGIIHFNQAFGAAPRIVMSAQDQTSQAAQIFPASKTANNFSLQTGLVPAAQMTYTFDYVIIE